MYVCFYIQARTHTQPMQDEHVKLNPKLPWQKQLSTRRNLFLPAI
jgi:hypothetical protein